MVKRMAIHAREGDFLETRNGLIFDVKGYSHPPKRVIAYLRYYPHSAGSRIRANEPYQKVYSLDKRYKILQDSYPRFLQFDNVLNKPIQSVPYREIRKIHEPQVYLERILKRTKTEYEKRAVEFVNLISNATSVYPSDLGISGSPMVGLNTPESDIDLIVYGRVNAQKVYNAMDYLFDDVEIPIRPYSLNELERLYKFKSQDTQISFENFMQFDSKKRCQGIFNHGTDFFIRNVYTWDEIESNIAHEYGHYQYQPLGEISFQATIHDDQDSLMTPCIYEVGNVKVLRGSHVKEIRQVISYRGRFTEARRGENIIVRGTLESVEVEDGPSFFQVVVGEKKDHSITYQ